jgi:hypothetical protein
MTVLLSIVGWFAISAFCTPLIGRVLFAMHQPSAHAGPARLAPIAVHRRSTQRRRVLHAAGSHRPIRQFNAG